MDLVKGRDDALQRTALLYARSKLERSLPAIIVSTTEEKAKKAYSHFFGVLKDRAPPLLRGDEILGYYIPSSLQDEESVAGFARDVRMTGYSEDERSARIRLRVNSEVYLEECRNQKWWVEFEHFHDERLIADWRAPALVEEVASHLTPFSSERHYTRALELVGRVCPSYLLSEARKMIDEAYHDDRREVLNSRVEKFWNLVVEDYEMVGEWQCEIEGQTGC